MRDHSSDPAQRIESFVVDADVWQAVANVLGQLPYAQVEPTIRKLERGSRPITHGARIRELNAAEEKLADFADELGALLESAQIIDESGTRLRELQERMAAAGTDRVATEEESEQNGDRSEAV